MRHKSLLFRTKYDSAHKLLLENKILPAEIQIAKTSLNRLFDMVQQTNIQDQRKFRIIGHIEIKVNNRQMIFLSQKNANQNGVKIQ